jgi:hypothetical protein
VPVWQDSRSRAASGAGRKRRPRERGEHREPGYRGSPCRRFRVRATALTLPLLGPFGKRSGGSLPPARLSKGPRCGRGAHVAARTGLCASARTHGSSSQRTISPSLLPCACSFSVFAGKRSGKRPATQDRAEPGSTGCAASARLAIGPCQAVRPGSFFRTPERHRGHGPPYGAGRRASGVAKSLAARRQHPYRSRKAAPPAKFGIVAP